ncbi:MAG: FAD-dependent oxidoreductase, partial [Caulobacterales bacterium]|nr:FAD-dependent oxidoreductase [Caulobacterales bacterium]
VADGTARLAAPGAGEVALSDGGETSLSADHIILATGARPRTLPDVTPDRERIWTYFEAMVPEETPRSLLVIGSGAIGTEFASLYADLGASVTLVELEERILPGEDADISAFVRRQFTRRGMEVLTGARVTAAEPDADGVSCRLLDATGAEQERRVDRVILAAGVQGNIEDLGLEQAGVATDRGFIATGPFCETSASGIYAIGDVAGPPCLAHKASHEGVICVEHLAGVRGVRPLDRAHVPGCTYCRPQVASLGLTEAAARAEGLDIRVGRFDLQANGKALAIAEGAGFVKTVFDAVSGELLGAHMVGPEVTEQIQGFGVAHSLEMTADELAHVIVAHPTVSEAMHEAVLDSLGRVMHQ